MFESSEGSRSPLPDSPNCPKVAEMPPQDRPKGHPILATVEGPVGTWRMIDSLGNEYGLIRLVRLDGQPLYRTEFRGEHLGYGGTLRSSCERVHAALIQSGRPAARIGFETEASADARARRNAPHPPEGG